MTALAMLLLIAGFVSFWAGFAMVGHLIGGTREDELAIERGIGLVLFFGSFVLFGLALYWNHPIP